MAFDWAYDIRDKIVNTVSDIGKTVVDAGKNAIESVGNAVSGFFSNLGSAFG